MATTTYTIECPTCATPIEHSFHGWICTAPDCGFAAYDDSREEAELLTAAAANQTEAEVEVWDADKPGHQITLIITPNTAKWACACGAVGQSYKIQYEYVV